MALPVTIRAGRTRIGVAAFAPAVMRQMALPMILYPRYRGLWFSNLFFFSGVWTQTLALGWLVFEITHCVAIVRSSVPPLAAP